jgi:hypothetical protein
VRKKSAAFDVKESDYTLTFHVYGRDGVMAEREIVHEIRSHELGIVADVVARDQETASAVLAMTRTNLLHTDFPGRLCREGNMAFPFSPSDIEAGPVYRFVMNHVVEVDDPCAMFPIEFETL